MPTCPTLHRHFEVPAMAEEVSNDLVLVDETNLLLPSTEKSLSPTYWKRHATAKYWCDVLIRNVYKFLFAILKSHGLCLRNLNRLLRTLQQQTGLKLSSFYCIGLAFRDDKVAGCHEFCFQSVEKNCSLEKGTSTWSNLECRAWWSA